MQIKCFGEKEAFAMVCTCEGFDLDFSELRSWWRSVFWSVRNMLKSKQDHRLQTNMAGDGRFREVSTDKMFLFEAE